MKRQMYLGDGVYAEIDDDARLLCLSTGDCGDQKPDNVIFLEPEVWVALKRFVESL